jgi:chromosome segregation ATPase
MLNTYQIYEELLQTMGDDTARVLTRTLARVYEDLQNTVTKTEFGELKAVVAKLADAQLRTEARLDVVAQRINELAQAQLRTEARLDVLTQRVDSLAQRMEELIEAQRRTEARLDALTQRMEELAQAQLRTEARLDVLTQRVDSLAQRMEELAEAQRRTEARLDALTQRMEELAEAQRRTDARLDALTQRVDSLAQRMDELAQAQKKTEECLQALIGRVDKVEQRLEGLSNSVGYSLEDRAYKALPSLLEAHGIRVTSRVIRRYFGEIQINIFAHAQKDGQDIAVIGECKVRPSKKEIDKFLKLADMVCRDAGFRDRVLVFVANDYHPNVEAYLQDKGILYFWSYEF